MTFADHVLSFLRHLDLEAPLPPGVAVMNPFRDPKTYGLCRRFYRKYYHDHRPRHLVIGINPGRFGGGITGIPFTDPIRLQEACGIRNGFVKKQELSSVFVYEMIRAFGGTERFYQSFYISSVSPLGFTRQQKNLNYYDDRALQECLRDFVTGCLEKQLSFGLSREVAYCLGEGKNHAYLEKLNREHRFFEKITPLPHPRFIMQYRLKQKEAYIREYLVRLQAAGQKP